MVVSFDGSEGVVGRDGKRFAMIGGLQEARGDDTLCQPLRAEVPSQRPGEMTEHGDAGHQGAGESQTLSNLVAVDSILARGGVVASDRSMHLGETVSRSESLADLPAHRSALAEL